MIIPTVIQVETLNGACSARCPMCTIDQWTRPFNRMDEATFAAILAKLEGIKSHITMMTLNGMGEPLLDKGIPEKVRMARDFGVPEVGFPSNCTNLSEDMGRRLLDARLSALICSIDGTSAATHEAIRPLTDFTKIVENVERFIAMRDAGGYATKIMVRFIYQPSNEHEWEGYKEFWAKRLDLAKGDRVMRFDLHNWAGERTDRNGDLGGEPVTCSYLWERMVIFSNGDLSLCCVDDNGWFKMGNILESDPVELFNQPLLRDYRAAMERGDIATLKHCGSCNVPYQRDHRELESVAVGVEEI